MTGDVTIRPARLGDAADIAQLSHELGYPVVADVIRARLAALDARAEHWVAVAEAPGPPLLGWIHVAHRITLETGEGAEILGLVVGALARRRGVGKLLVDSGERWSRERGLTKIIVRSNIVRPESHEFYPAVGYVRAKTSHVYSKSLSGGATTGE
jgi:GNAT superfamily N-acetyltransferase